MHGRVHDEALEAPARPCQLDGLADPPEVDALGDLALGARVRHVRAVVDARDVASERAVLVAREPQVERGGVALDHLHAAAIARGKAGQGFVGVLPGAGLHDDTNAGAIVLAQHLGAHRAREERGESRDEDVVVDARVHSAPRRRSLASPRTGRNRAPCTDSCARFRRSNT